MSEIRNAVFSLEKSLREMISIIKVASANNPEIQKLRKKN